MPRLLKSLEQHKPTGDAIPATHQPAVLAVPCLHALLMHLLMHLFHQACMHACAAHPPATMKQKRFHEFWYRCRWVMAKWPARLVPEGHTFVLRAGR